MTREEFDSRALACLDSLYAYAWRLTRDREDAADLVQETYLRALTRIGSFPSAEAVRPMLFTMLHNRFVDDWRRKKRRPILVPLDAPGFPVEGLGQSAARPATPSAEIVRESLGEEVDAALNALRLELRETLWLREIDDFSYEAIGAITGSPIGTVRSRLARARRHLARSLADFAKNRGFTGQRDFGEGGGSP